MIKNGFKRTRTGIALLLVIGILGLLSLVGISFALNMLLTRKEANNYLNSVKARYIAEAGIKRAIMDIRGQVATASYNSLKTYIGNYVAANGTNVAFPGGRYTLAITSEEDKVNLNTFDETDAAQLTILRTFLTDQQIANIIDYRDSESPATNTTIGVSTGNIEGTAQCKDKPFDSINEIRAATGINQTAFDNNRNLLTISKPIIRGGLLGKYYSDWNTFSNSTILNTVYYRGKVVELGNFEEHYIEGADGDGLRQHEGKGESHDAEFAGGALVGTSANFGLDKFGVVWEGYLEILPSEAGNPITFRIKVDDGIRFFVDGTDLLVGLGWQDQAQASGNASNYTPTHTFQTPGWHRIRIDYYDNTGENALNLKWGGSDWDTASFVPAERFGYDPPTESGTYNSAGNYTVTCTAEVLKTGQVAAQKIISGIIKVFGTWTQTTKEEFYAAWFNDYAAGIPSGYVNAFDGSGPFTTNTTDYRDGEMRNVTWLDSCPLNATDNLEASGYFSDLNDATKFKRDSLKLGFWVDGDRDPGYSVSMLKALVLSQKWEDTPADFNNPKGWINIKTDDGSHNFFFISWGDFRDGYTTDGSDNELTITTGWHEGRRFEANPFYYFPSDSVPNTVDGTPDVFMRVWTGVDNAPVKIESGGNWEPRTYWIGEGTLYTGATDLVTGDPIDSDVHGIPVDAGGNEIINDFYSGSGLYGWAYDRKDADPLTNPDIPDGRYQIGERICKVHPKNSTARVMIYGASPLDLDTWPGNYTYWQSEMPFATPMIYAAGERMDDINLTPPAQRGARGFSLLQKDTDNEDTGNRGWTYAVDNNSGDQDMLELVLNSKTDTTPENPSYVNRVGWCGKDFVPASTLTMIGKNGEYKGYVKGKNKTGATVTRVTLKAAPDFPVTTPNFQFLSRNVYDASGDVGGWNEWAKWMTSAVVKGLKELKRSGGNSTVTTYWDNIRIIPQSGFLVSAPHVARSSTDADVRWGTVSWTEDKPANTDVKIYLRSTSTGLPTSDSFSALYTNGASVTGIGRVIQYKAVLTSTAFDATTVFYTASGGITPRLDDITITYIPAISVLYWKEGP